MQGRSDRRWLPVLVMALTLPLVGLPSLTAGMAVAAPTWLPGQTLSAPGTETGGAQVGLAANGDAVAVWGAGEFTDAVIQAAHREAGGSWSAPVTISAPALSSAPRLAVDPSGEAVALWRRYDGANFRAQAASRAPGGDWTAPINISPPGVEAYDPAVAIDGAGQITAVWSRYDGFGFRVQARTRTAGGTWRLVENLSTAGADARQPQVAVNSTDGETTVSWSYGKLGQEVIHARTRPASSFTWKQPEDLSEGSGAIYPHVGVAAAGETAVVWTRTAAMPNATVQGRVRAAGQSTFGEIAELSATNGAG